MRFNQIIDKQTIVYNVIYKKADYSAIHKFYESFYFDFYVFFKNFVTFCYI